ncbi:MAG: hypothetical protein CSA79_05805 [Thiothrix nivea]|nr:MAG: hypothetical protein CSA79_05805 [Thiothrix nivea]
MLSLPVLVWVGAISYSLYLWHWPILAFIRYISGPYELNFGQSIVYWVVAFTLASLSYYLIERWFRKKNLKFSEKLTWLGLFVFVALTAIFAQKFNKKFVSPMPVEFTRYADHATICHGKIVGDCLRGDRNSIEKPILVLGDSHAAMLNYFFDAIGRELKLSFRVITASSCVTIPGFDYKRIADWAQKSCIEQIEEVNQFLRTDKVIISSMWNYHLKNDEFKNALRLFLRTSTNKKILLLADIPHFKNYNPVRAYRFLKIGLGAPLPNIDGSVTVANNNLYNIAQQYQYVDYLNLTDNAMFKEIPIYKGNLIYSDNHHLNEFGSSLYADSVKESLHAYFDAWLEY